MYYVRTKNKKFITQRKTKKFRINFFVFFKTQNEQKPKKEKKIILQVSQRS